MASLASSFKLQALKGNTMNCNPIEGASRPFTKDTQADCGNPAALVTVHAASSSRIKE
jgi:hypothetical protein